MAFPRLRGAYDVFRAAGRGFRDARWAGFGEFVNRWAGGVVAPPTDDATHLQRTIDWLCRAQDHSGCGGVSLGYDLLKGWRAAYPETTGYIIPTFYELAGRFARPDLAERALRMAHWESDEQMECGAVMAGTVDSQPRETAIFNTGQVLFGWTRAFQETREERFAESARRAGAWMLECLDPDGAWRRGLSPKAALKGPRSYNVRSAWGLLLAGQALKREDFIDGARRDAQWTVSQQKPNGWIDCCCLSDAKRPLTHTLGYAAEGLLEIGLALDDARFIDAARRLAEPLAKAVDERGFLAGRFDEQWKPAVDWSCLTGQCQMAIVWLRLAKLDAAPELAQVARRALAFVKGQQSADARNPTTCGAIPGSSPITGGYGRLKFLNWAAKFFIDALLLSLDAAEGHGNGTRHGALAATGASQHAAKRG
jgi:hypothetical protein